ncbi:hypothetical protein AVEN_26940-1 [Araneus ventricosus]|uniref:Uncharacterized protein n=1 Tax=Araneus ventricosus TaxID=182803 RepID=A0A4Y2WKE7_ARAVE|nr:hypothetical protein AVEN_26940-1 [Araneus ventricosus]
MHSSDENWHVVRSDLHISEKHLDVGSKLRIAIRTPKSITINAQELHRTGSGAVKSSSMSKKQLEFWVIKLKLSVSQTGSHHAKNQLRTAVDVLSRIFIHRKAFCCVWVVKAEIRSLSLQQQPIMAKTHVKDLAWCGRIASPKGIWSVGS